MIRKLALLIIILTNSLIILSQEADDFISNFLAVQQDDHVFLRWTIKGGNTCDGTRIQQSVDNIYFEEIGDIPGVCGSADEPVTYDFTDSLPEKNRINYYRLELGLIGLTSPMAVDFIILNESGYSIQPNPVTSRSKLVFENPENEEIEFCLIDARGRMVMNEFTTSNHVWIDRNMTRSGSYVFKLRKDQKLLNKGKLVVL